MEEQNKKTVRFDTFDSSFNHQVTIITNFVKACLNLEIMGGFMKKLTKKEPLNLDKEIEGILDENTSADVVLGSIKLTF